MGSTTSKTNGTVVDESINEAPAGGLSASDDIMDLLMARSPIGENDRADGPLFVSNLSQDYHLMHKNINHG
jgi:hypothetical protein